MTRSNSQPCPPSRATDSAIRVLIVDDDPFLCEAVQELLETFGFHASSATEGTAALELLGPSGGSPFDLIVLDASLALGGEECVYQQVRRFHSELPVVVASGYSREHLVDKHPYCADARFIQKPWAIEDLVDLLCETHALATAR